MNKFISLMHRTTLTHRVRHVPGYLLLFLLSVLVSGCGIFSGGSPQEEKYTLQYSSPTFEGLPRLGAMLKVDRFVIAERFRTKDMASSPTAFTREVYSSAGWDASPKVMVTDLLLRDFRNSGLYHAVFSHRDDGEARFILQGSVDEFLEVDDPDGPKAVMTLTVTLLYSAQKEPGRRVLFQKSYRALDPMESKTSQSLARGMSAILEQLSKQIQMDVYNAVKNPGPA